MDGPLVQILSGMRRLLTESAGEDLTAGIEFHPTTTLYRTSQILYSSRGRPGRLST